MLRRFHRVHRPTPRRWASMALAFALMGSALLPLGSPHTWVVTPAIFPTGGAAVLRAEPALVVGTPLQGPGPTPNWRNASGGAAPPPGASGTLAYDSVAGEVVWVGGDVNGSAETWTYSAGLWTNRTAALSPDPAAAPGAVLAADPAAGGVILLASPAGASVSETWRFASGSWTDLLPATSPPARSDAAVAYDPADGRLVLFGGEQNDSSLSDTWTFDGANWSLASPASRPAPRASAGLAFDPPDAEMVLAGGVNGTAYLNDTWTWDGASWSLVAGAGAPSGVATGPEALAPVPYGGLVAFGGLGCGDRFGVCNGTYEFEAGRWSVLSSAGAPSPRLAMALAYDAADGYVLGFGGTVGIGATSSETWALGGPVSATLRLAQPVMEPPGYGLFLGGGGGGYGAYGYVYSDPALDCLSVSEPSFLCGIDADTEGNSTVTVVVTDALGNVTNATAPLDLVDPLLAFELISPGLADVGQLVEFSIDVPAPAAGVNYTWHGLPRECPDTYLGSFSCTVQVPGFYGIYCDVVGALGAEVPTSIYTLNVTPRPTVTAWSDRTTGSIPLNVQFSSNVSGGVAPYVYAWTFGDGTTSTLADPSHAFAMAGTYPVTLQVTDSVGVTVGWTDPVPIAAAVGITAAIVATTASWQSPATVHLSAIVHGGSAPFTYAWTYGNGGSGSSVNVSATYSTPGTYEVNLTVVDAHGATTTATALLSVLAPTAPPAPAAASTPWWQFGAVAVVGLVVGLIVAPWVAGRRWTGRPPRDDDPR